MPGYVILKYRMIYEDLEHISVFYSRVFEGAGLIYYEMSS